MNHYVLTGAAGNITKPLALHLLQAGHRVTVIGRSEANLAALTEAGATAAIGAVEDEAFLTETFRGADAVYTMVPPNFATDAWVDYIGSVGETFARAIAAAGVRKVVNLSSVGAHMPEGAGPVSGLYRVEAALNALEGIDVLHLRAGFFYQNFYANIGMIKGMNILGGNYGTDSMPMVHTDDIADAAYEALTTLSFSGKTVRYVISDNADGATIAKALGTAVGKPELPWIQFEDEASRQGMMGAGVPEHQADLYTEMGQAMRTGAMPAHYLETDGQATGTRKLDAFAREFAAVYNSN